MLAEGIQLFVTFVFLLNRFRQKRYKDTYILVGLAWGKPAWFIISKPSPISKAFVILVENLFRKGYTDVGDLLLIIEQIKIVFGIERVCIVTLATV